MQEGTKYVPTDAVDTYFDCIMDEKDGTFMVAREKQDVIERELKPCGYFVTVTSQKMTAKEAITLYKSRDASEKLYCGDKTYLGNQALRVHSNESAAAKIFIEFVALIVRSRIYTRLKDRMAEMDKRPNYTTVPAALKELEKIEMVRDLKHIYQIDHAITKTQKEILRAFGVDVTYVKSKATRISEQLQLASA